MFFSKKGRRNFNFSSSSNKGIGPVIASGLLLVIAIVSVVGFQTWFNTYSTTIFSDAEQKSLNENSLIVEDIVGNRLYIRNKGTENITITQLKLSNFNCNVTATLEPGINSLSLNYCMQNISTGSNEVTVITDKNVNSKKMFIEDIVIDPTEEPYTNISSCTDINSQGNYRLNTDITSSSTNDCITISSGNVNLNCNANLIQGDGAATRGIYVYTGVYNVTANILIENCNVDNWAGEGVYVLSTGNVTLDSLNVTNSVGTAEGIYFRTSRDNIIRNINSSNNFYGFYGYSMTYTNITNFYTKTSNRGFFLTLSSYNRVDRGSIYDSTNVAFEFATSSNNFFTNSLLYNVGDALNIRGNYNYADNITIFGDDSSSEFALSFGNDARENNISNIDVDNIWYGVGISSGYDNIVFNSTFNITRDIFYLFSTGYDNIFYGNYFENSTDVRTDTNVEQYFNSSISGVNIGNYWEDFIPSCLASEARGDYFVCTNPNNVTIDIDSNWTDYAPLVYS